MPELVSDALARNPKTRAQWEWAKAAAANVGAAKAAYYPTVTFEGILGIEYYEEPDFPGFKKVGVAAAGPAMKLTYLLLDFGGRGAEVEAARAQLTASEFVFEQSLQDTILAVQMAYFEMAAGKASVRATEAMVKLAAEQLDSKTTGLAAGLAIDDEVLAARARLAETERDLAVARTGLANASAALNRACGYPPQRPVEIGSLPGALNVPLLDHGIDKLIAASLSARPDLQAKFAEVRQRDAAVRKVESTYWPTVTFEAGGYSYWYTARAENNLVRTGPFNERGQDQLVGGELIIEWELFDGFYRERKVEAARAEAEAARAAALDAELATAEGVWNAYHDYLSTARDVLFREAALKAARSQLDIALEGFAAGLVNIVARQAAETRFAQAEAAETAARAAWLAAAAKLVYAAGKLRPPK